MAQQEVSLKIVLRPGTLLGPGKADLLEGIKETGSIAAAGRRMQMSYKRAWQLIDTLNACFREPAVITTKGGPGHGGAQLTPTGEAILTAYRRIQAGTNAAIADELDLLAPLMKKTDD
jgi:molybdate transport system regulatory protein